MRFSSLSMMSSTHLRCTDCIIAALLVHPNYKSEKNLIHEAQKIVLNHKGKWAYAFHLPKREAKEGLTKCLPNIIKKQQSSGLWKENMLKFILTGFYEH